MWVRFMGGSCFSITPVKRKLTAISEAFLDGLQRVGAIAGAKKNIRDPPKPRPWRVMSFFFTWEGQDPSGGCDVRLVADYRVIKVDWKRPPIHKPLTWADPFEPSIKCRTGEYTCNCEDWPMNKSAFVLNLLCLAFFGLILNQSYLPDFF